MAQFSTNAGALALRTRMLADKAQANFARAGNAAGAALKAEAVRLSSGTLTPAEMRALGGPYARRLPANSAPRPDSEVNVKGGAFRDSWHFRARKTARGWTVDLWNDAPASAFLLGTALMRSRPILQEVVRRAGPALPAAARQAVRLTVREHGGYSAPLPAWAGVAYAVGVGAASAGGALGAGLGAGA